MDKNYINASRILIKKSATLEYMADYLYEMCEKKVNEQPNVEILNGKKYIYYFQNGYGFGIPIVGYPVLEKNDEFEIIDHEKESIMSISLKDTQKINEVGQIYDQFTSPNLKVPWLWRIVIDEQIIGKKLSVSLKLEIPILSDI